jgi:hypothetical protein
VAAKFQPSEQERGRTGQENRARRTEQAEPDRQNWTGRTGYFTGRTLCKYRGMWVTASKKAKGPKLVS